MKKILLFIFLLPTLAFAQLELPFPIKLVNPKPVDFWYFESDGTPYDNTGEVISQVLSAIRYRGMTFNVNGVEYWFGAGIADVDLVIKSTAGNLTGAVTSSGLATSLGSFTSNALGTAISDPVRTVTGTDAIVQADNGRTIYFNSATPFNFTIDALTINTFTMFRNIGTATVSFVDGSGVTSTGATELLADEVGGVEYIASTTPIISKAVSGGMLESVYDPATIAEQLVGLTASQSLTNKSINGVTLNGAGSSSLFLNQAGGYTSPVSSFWSLATGGTLTGVNTITSNVNSGINFAGTWTATATSQSNLNFGGTFTAFGGSPNILYGYRFNPTLIGSGTGGTQVGVQINPSFSGGTSPNNIYLQVGNITPIASYGFQAYTGYFSGALRFDANLNDNRDNNIIQQSSSATSSNRTMTIANTSYTTVDFVHNGTLQSNQSAMNSTVARNAFKVIGGAHTNLTLSNPVVDVYFNIGRTVQSAAGTITNNRYVYIENPTHSFVGASTSSREVTVAIKGAPTAGTNATFTNSIGLEVESSNVTAGTATSYGIYTNAQTGASINYALGVNGTMTLSSPANDDALTQVLVRDGTTGEVKYRTSSSIVGGDVVGPSSSVSDRLAIFSGTSGKLLKADAIGFTSPDLIFYTTSDPSIYPTGATPSLNLTIRGGNGLAPNNDGGSLNLSSGAPIGTGVETSVNIQTRSAGKIGFFNTTAIVQPTTGITAATFTANTSLIANDTATFDGYTIGQIVKALRNLGILQ